MNILNVPVIVALGGALIVLGCDRAGPEADPPVAQSPSPATPPRPPAPVSDPSLPPAGPALGGQAAASAPAARHDGSTQPMAPLTKSEEQAAMPKPAQANDHSNTALDPKKESKP